MEALVYVVDDEKVIATTLATILTKSGFEAVAFNNPLDALKSAESRCPDVLISDVVMPQLNGIDLGVQFKAIYPNCKVLLFSGQASTSHMLKVAAQGGHSFDMLQKPIHPMDLVSAIHSILGGVAK